MEKNQKNEVDASSQVLPSRAARDEWSQAEKMILESKLKQREEEIEQLRLKVRILEHALDLALAHSVGRRPQYYRKRRRR